MKEEQLHDCLTIMKKIVKLLEEIAEILQDIYMDGGKDDKTIR